MATIGKIDIAMGVDTSKLSKGFSSSASMLDGFGSSVVGIGTKLAALAGVGLSVGGMVAFAKSSLTAVDALNDQATQIGTTVGKLGELHYAAQLTGSSTESLDAGMQKLSTNLGHAVREGGPAANTIASLGLNVRSLAAMDPADAFLSIAGAISKVPNPALQASAAMDVFGKGGAGLLNTLRAGPTQLGALTAEAQRLGLSVSAIDAAKIGATNDALDRMSAAFQGVGNTLASAVAPYVTQAADGVVNLTAKITNGEGVFGGLATAGGVAMEGFAAAFGFMSDQLTAGMTLVSEYFETALNAIGLGIPTIADFGAAFTATMTGASSLIRNFGTYWEMGGIKVAEFAANTMAALGTLPANFAIVTSYLGENWSALLTDMANATVTAFTNIGTNLGQLMFAASEFIQGRGFTPDFKPMLEGFKATAAALPAMVEPVWVSMEGQMSAKWKQIEDTDKAAAASKIATAMGSMGAAAGKAKRPGEDDILRDRTAPKLAGIADMGSSAAYSAIAKFQSADKGKGLDLVASIAGQQLQVQKDLLAESRKKGNEMTPFTF